MKSDSCQVQMTSLSLTFTDMLASCLPLDRSHLLKLFLWCHAGLLCQTKSLLHLSREGLLSDLRDRQWKRERICLLLSWTCSHSCFVRISSDGCCFNLFSPHFFCLFILNLPLDLKSIFHHCGFIPTHLQSRWHCESLQSGMDMYMISISQIVK